MIEADLGPYRARVTLSRGSEDISGVVVHLVHKESRETRTSVANFAPRAGQTGGPRATPPGRGVRLLPSDVVPRAECYPAIIFQSHKKLKTYGTLDGAARVARAYDLGRAHAAVLKRAQPGQPVELAASPPIEGA